MRTPSLPLAVCLLLIACGTAAAQGTLAFTVSPVHDGGTVTVNVTSAPDPSAIVEFKVGTQYYQVRTCTVPGSVQFEVPQGSKAQMWRVVVTSGTHQSEQGGFVLPAIEPGDV